MFTIMPSRMHAVVLSTDQRPCRWRCVECVDELPHQLADVANRHLVHTTHAPLSYALFCSLWRETPAWTVAHSTLQSLPIHTFNIHTFN